MKAKIGRPKLKEPYKPLQISVPERLHEQCKTVVKEFVKMNNTKCVTQNVIIIHFADCRRWGIKPRNFN